MGGKRQRKALDGEVERRTCTAHTRDGTPCKNAPILGGTTCRMHGGAAPQVRAKANQRLLDGVPKMLTELRRIATDESVPPPTRLAAVRDWLDRAGIGESDKHELTINVPKWEQGIENLLVDFGQEADIVDAEIIEDPYEDAKYPERATGRSHSSGPPLTHRDPDAAPNYGEPTP